MSREEMMWETLHDQIHDQVADNARLRRALDLAGIPAQAKLDDKAPPLRINVKQAREIMGVVDGE